MTLERQLPRDISVEHGKKHQKFKELIESKLSPFYKKTMKDVFMYALGIGFANNKRAKLKKKAGTIPLRTFNENDKALIKSIAIAETGSMDVLFGENIKEAFDIAEEYANGGIDTLYSLVFGDEPGDPDRKMEQELRIIIEKCKQK